MRVSVFTISYHLTRKGSPGAISVSSVDVAAETEQKAVALARKELERDDVELVVGGISHIRQGVLA